ncbi:MAG: hypothetical protein E6K75_01795 [Candidatus Eisenbacteria bacterium]|uniref:UspA domain-containing protein n=1 Tax=Eiseniibacteriota bacterium TaxID=2212470 RepID=A0A538TCA4_UNCEI|nr:MAG: hypothetical protein E6K75_01795 [Candidatus Eisenbacteria bacterium]
MYRKILIPLDASSTDRAIVTHIRPIAKLMQSRVVLLHVATGWAAQWFGPSWPTAIPRGRSSAGSGSTAATSWP